ncbi:MAG TPA: phosphoglycolate phosphatase [Rhodospirillaceae bacterium]|nr:phosphoglycolate phosphatase [Rhodospirillaceae bacterium]
MNFLQEPTAILFDLDGTLVDSLPDLFAATNRLLADLGRPAVSGQDLRQWVGDGAAALVERALTATGGLPEGGMAPMVRRFLDHYRGHTADESRPYPGVAETLALLRRRGHRLGVCTNKPTALSLELLGALDLLPFFLAVVGGDTAPARKPDPRHLWATLEAMGCAGAKALMVGDSLNDVAAARAAGLPVVVMSFGYCRGDPGALGADAVIDDFARLLDGSQG